MKKLLFIVCILLTIVFFTITCYAYDSNIQPSSNMEISEVNDNSPEGIYRDMVISLLIPKMQEKINEYYKDYLTELPIIFSYSVDVVKIEREVGGGYLINLEVIVHPFVGPINIVGEDRILIETGAFGTVEIKEYQHIKDYELPWNWKHIIKKVS